LDEKTLQLQRVYTPADGLAGTVVSTLAAEGGTLWVGTNGGVSRLDPRTGKIRTTWADGYWWSFELDAADNHLWALSERTAIRFGRSQGPAQAFPYDERYAKVIRDGETLWTVMHQPDDRYRIARLDTVTGNRDTLDLTRPDTSGLPDLIVGPENLWVAALTIGLRRGCRLFRVDKRSLQAAPQTPALGLAHDCVEDLTVLGSDVWVRTTGDYDQRAHVGIGGKLCRYDRATGRWNTRESISGAKHDEPTCLAVLDGDLWVATRAYAKMKKMVVGWGMMPIEAESPSLTGLTLNRFLPETERWQTYHIPAATDFDRVVAVARHENRVWFLLQRNAIAQSYEQLRQATKRHLVAGYVDVESPASEAVLSDQSPMPSTWDDRWRGGKPVELVVTGDAVWVRRLFGLWRRTAEDSWQELELEGALPDVRQLRLFTIDGSTIVSCASRALRFEPQSSQWVPWTIDPPWRVCHVSKDPSGTWWVSAAMGRIELPADSERSDADRQPLQSGLFRSSDGAAWDVPSVAPWTWHQADVEGEVHFLPVETVKQTPRDLDLWGRSSAEGPRLGARRAAQAKSGDGVSRVQSDGEQVWVGTFGEGVFCLEENRWRRLWPKSDPAAQRASYFVSRAPEDTVVSMVLDGDSLWIATMANLRRYRISDGTLERLDSRAVGIEPAAESLHMSEPGNLLDYGPTLAKAAGRVWFSPGAAQEKAAAYSLQEGSPEWKCAVADVRGCCFAGSGDFLWMGTQEGLLRYNTRTEQFRKLTTQDGLVANQIRSLALDGRFLWVGTASGISRVERAVFESAEE
jgi:hypothetical protein